MKDISVEVLGSSLASQLGWVIARFGFHSTTYDFARLMIVFYRGAVGRLRNEMF
jgi:hypothetical protein